MLSLVSSPPTPTVSLHTVDKGSTCPYGEQKDLETMDRKVAIMAVTDEGKAKMEPKQRQQKTWPSLTLSYLLKKVD